LEGEIPRVRARSNSAALKPCKSTLIRSLDEGVIPEPPDMRSVSDNGAGAPISALTYAFIFISNRGHQADDFEPISVESPTASGLPPLATRFKADAFDLEADCEATQPVAQPS
jgi:hypothetical protein